MQVTRIPVCSLWCCRWRIDNSQDLCFYLLEEHDVALVPGHAFGGPDGVRLSYAASMSDLDEALNRIEAGLAALR